MTIRRPAISGWLRAAAPNLLYGVRLWAAVCLALFLAFWLELDNPSWAGATAALVCQPVLGAALRKGWFRLIGTVVGAIAAVVLSACFPQNRAVFLLGLAIWGAACALTATLLRNFASYAAALSGYTAAIIIGDELGAIGGPNGDAFQLAIARTSEISLGIVCAGLVLATTDLGSTRRRLATLLAGLSAEIAGGLSRAVRMPKSMQAESRTQRRRLALRIAGLGTVIDQAAGEISNLAATPSGNTGCRGQSIRCSHRLALGRDPSRVPTCGSRASGSDWGIPSARSDNSRGDRGSDALAERYTGAARQPAHGHTAAGDTADCVAVAAASLR